MNIKSQKTIFWLPRILGVLFSLFIGSFSLDVFEETVGFWETLLALFIHLIPFYVLLTVLIISWRYDIWGVILYFVLAVFYLIFSRGKLNFLTYFLIIGPLLITALLFYFSWLIRRTEPPK